MTPVDASNNLEKIRTPHTTSNTAPYYISETSGLQRKQLIADRCK